MFIMTVCYIIPETPQLDPVKNIPAFPGDDRHKAQGQGQRKAYAAGTRQPFHFILVTVKGQRNRNNTAGLKGSYQNQQRVLVPSKAAGFTRKSIGINKAPLKKVGLRDSRNLVVTATSLI